MRLLRPRPRRSTVASTNDGPASPGGSAAAETDDLRRQADVAESEGRLIDAVDLLRRAIRAEPDDELEAHLVALRHLAFAEAATTSGRPEWPPAFDDLTPGDPGPPRVGVADLSPEVLGSALVNHGALHVEQLLDPEQVEAMVAGIDRAFAGRDRWGEDPTAATGPWFVPFEPSPAYMPEVLSRAWVREGGGVWAADSPRVFFELLEAYDAIGLADVIGGYLGERPAISMRKCTLRRVPADLPHADWHQDGAFLGSDVRSVNVWLPLTRCGGASDSPGLEYVPRRIDEVLETGTNGAIFDWSVGPGTVEAVVASTASTVIRPQFEAGDALLFDDVFLHRTAVAPDLSVDRYAIEAWFFAPSTYPADQIPLVF
jgi:hypothetical protein